MAILSSQFSKALESIEPSADDKANAPEAHKAVRAALTGAEELKDWGLDPVLIGSYGRDVSIDESPMSTCSVGWTTSGPTWLATPSSISSSRCSTPSLAPMPTATSA